MDPFRSPFSSPFTVPTTHSFIPYTPRTSATWIIADNFRSAGASRQRWVSFAGGGLGAWRSVPVHDHHCDFPDESCLSCASCGLRALDSQWTYT